ncbi:MAG TPA: MmcQ/YjbR family DNA-binding protein [Chthoniobacterales bacterium]|jgi:predicted DNA-binding protein (MmcQ/YjbR family)
MDLEAFRDYCLAKAGASEDMPFGPDTIVFKVQKKMFALASLEAVPPRVNLKCNPELALELRDLYEEIRPGYHMNKKHWNTIELNGRIPAVEIRKMIDHSYDLVVARRGRER